jgi:hypothetical protein
VNELINIIKDLKNLSVGDKEKMLLLKIINNQYKLQNTKFKKIKDLFRVLGKTYGPNQHRSIQRDEDPQWQHMQQQQQEEEEDVPSVEKSLIEKGLIEKSGANSITPVFNNNPIIEKNHSKMLERAVESHKREGEEITHEQQQKQQQQQQFRQNYKITSKGLIHIFGGNYIYSPEFLLIYENDIVLQKILYRFFLPNTIKSSTARFFSIVTEYLTTVSKYLQNFSNDIDDSITVEKINREVEFNLRILSYLLGYKVAVLFNDSSLLSSSQEIENEKTMLVIYELENSMKKTLSKDNKFKNFLQTVNDEFSNGYKEIMDQER